MVWYVSVLAGVLLLVGGLIYVLLARALYARIDDSLESVVAIAATSLDNDLAEGQDTADAARSTAAELSSSNQMLAIYDGSGQLLAEARRDDELDIILPPPSEIPGEESVLVTVPESDDDDRHRLAIRRVTVGTPPIPYIVVVGNSLERTDEELESLRAILRYLVPGALVFAAFGGWFLVRQGLAPLTLMAERAQRISAHTLSDRLPVSNPRDEIGQLAGVFNDLLGRLETALDRQRRFMADASHELRTPVAIARAAANVALQQAHRAEAEYRDTLGLIERQTIRMSRSVDDMFVLARADAGSYPVQHELMYLDEVIDETVSAARILAAEKDVTIAFSAEGAMPFEGDEELVRRLVSNLVGNAVRHTRSGSAVRVTLHQEPQAYRIVVTDAGPGIPPELQPRIFERFFSGGSTAGASDGAGLGLSVAQWIASVHHGRLELISSTAEGTSFEVHLPFMRSSLPLEKEAPS